MTGKWRTMLALALCAVMLITLAACSGGNAEKPGGTPTEAVTGAPTDTPTTDVPVESTPAESTEESETEEIVVTGTASADAEATDPEDPTEATDPEDPTEATDPEDPTEATDPEDPTVATDPEDPTQGTEPEDPTEATDPEDPTQGTEPEDPTVATDPEDPTQGTEPEDPTEPPAVENKISFKTLQVSGTDVYGKVPNATTSFSFINEIKISGDATYTVSLDIYGMQVVATKTVALSVGDNVFYVLETVGNEIQLYTVTIRRRPIHTVTFDACGGSAVAAQSVEEDHFATAPEAPEKEGYTFVGWDFDFSAPITKNTEIKATWTANEYTVTYDVNGGDALQSATQSVTYDE